MGTSRSRASDAALWAACAAGAAVPWAWAPGLRDAWALPKTLAAAVCALAGAAAWAAAGAPSLAVGVERPLAAFLAAVAAAAVLSADPSVAWWGPDLEPAAGAVGAFAAAAGLYLGAAARRLRADASEAFARAVSLGAAPMGLWAFLQGPGAAYLGRASGTFGHPVAFGAFLAVAAPFGLSWILTADSRAARAAGGACLGAIALGLAASGGRWAFVAAAGACAVTLWAEGRAWSRRAAATAVALGLAGAFVVALRFDAAGARAGGRLAAWKIAAGAVLDRPLLGWGPGTFSFLYRRDRDQALAYGEGLLNSFPHAHNDVLEVLTAAGLLGGAVYAWLHASVAARARHVWGPAGAAGLGGAAALFIQAKLNLPPVPALFLGAAGLGAALASAPAPAAGRAPAAALFLVAAVVAAAVPLSRLPAERADHLGRLARAQGRPRDAAGHLEAAVAGAPGVLRFRLDLMNLLADLAEGAPPAERDAYLTRARDVALDGARLRPAEPEFARLLGLAELRRAAAGADSLPAARAALEAARAADPFNPLTLGTLADVAALEARTGRIP